MRRSKFNLNHYRLMSGRMGELIPSTCMEMLPGDTFRMRTTSMVRLSPMVTPVMHPIYMRMHYFFVPNRIIWEDWEEFIVDMNTDLSVPSVSPSSSNPGEVDDYLGIPPGDYSNNPFNVLPRRAYNRVWNEFYRDQDLDTERAQQDASLARVRWGKDYFTTARVEAQSGATETVDIEFDQDVPIAGLYGGANTYSPESGMRASDGTDVSGDAARVGDGQTGNLVFVEENPNAAGYPNVRIPAGAVGGSMDINEWRRAMAWQRLAEHRNKYGSRYTDYLAFLGVRALDQRLNRPEFIGGGSGVIQISEVLSTADTSSGGFDGAPVGALAGHGIGGKRTRPITYFAQEHGYVLGLCSIRPLAVYESAVPRTFWRQKPADFWQKEMEIMGDQPVWTKEIRGPADNPDDIFGYVDRHRDYREHTNGVAGEFRDVLDTWHLARDFTSDPQLNSSFVECTPTERIFADTNTDVFQLMANHQVTARRLVSKRARV